MATISGVEMATMLWLANCHGYLFSLGGESIKFLLSRGVKYMQAPLRTNRKEINCHREWMCQGFSGVGWGGEGGGARGGVEGRRA